jgi:hypothetical protein
VILGALLALVAALLVVGPTGEPASVPAATRDEESTGPFAPRGRARGPPCRAHRIAGEEPTSPSHPPSTRSARSNRPRPDNRIPDVELPPDRRNPGALSADMEFCCPPIRRSPVRRHGGQLSAYVEILLSLDRGWPRWASCTGTGLSGAW